MYMKNLLVSASGKPEMVPHTYVSVISPNTWNIDKLDEDWMIVSAGPDGNNKYWEAWDAIIDKAVRIDENNRTMYLRMIDDDLYEVTYVFD